MDLVSTAKPARTGRAWWTRIHLIYFALAAFDLTAIGTGIWLSNYTNGKFEAAVHNFQISDLLRDNASAAIDAAVALVKPFEKALLTKDTAGALKDLKAASAAFDAALSTDHYNDEETKTALKAAVVAAGGSQEDFEEHAGLELFFPKAFAAYEELENRLIAKKAAIVADAAGAINSIAGGKYDVAAQRLSRSNALDHYLILDARQLFGISNEISDGTVAESVRAFGFADSLQYIIGGAILVMIALVCSYAYFVGNILRRKYDELEQAQVEATALAGQLQTVNDGMAELNVELAANMKKLAEAQDEVVRKSGLSQLGHLTATVAHELRNPLGAVRTSAFLIERKLKGKGLGVESQLERINNGISRCDNIISQLLDFARNKNLQCDSLVLDDWLAKLVEDEAQTLPEAVAVECHLGIGDTPVEFDPSRMSRVLINLIANASEAMVGKGDDPSKFVSSAPKITIESRMATRGAEISVSDNGPGIPDEIMQRILEPLYTTKSFGTGLGLPAAEKILEQHGGGLEIQSKPGQGASVTVWWPLKADMKEVA